MQTEHITHMAHVRQLEQSDQIEHISALQPTQMEQVTTQQPFVMELGFLQAHRHHLIYVQPGAQTPRPLEPKIHTHASYELVYVLEGVFTQHLERTVLKLNAGDAILLNRRIRHWEDFETECIVLYLNMKPRFLQKLLYDNPVDEVTPQQYSRYFSRLCPRDGSGAEEGMAVVFRRQLQRQSAEALTQVERLLDEIAGAQIRREWGYAFAVQGLLLQLAAQFEDPGAYHATCIQADASTEDVLFQTIIHYLREKSGRISRNELAEIMHYHPDYLNRIIKRHTGKSFGQLAQTLWVERAKELLDGTDYTVARIVEELEFGNKSYFYRVFQQTTGMTPLEYRMRRAGNAQQQAEG